MPGRYGGLETTGTCSVATFAPFGWMHFLVTAVSAAGWLLIVRASRPLAGTRAEQTFRLSLGLVILAVNLLFTVHRVAFVQQEFKESLPLQLCDLAWMVAAWSILSGGDPGRLQHQLAYYWGLGLSSFSYLTPVLQKGPATIFFWEYWTPHWLILAVAILNVAVFRVGPSWRSYLRVTAVTAALVGLGLLFNLAFDTSYCFTGRYTPTNPTLLDVLGPWPLRIVWMVLIGAAIFALMTLPACRRTSSMR
ncbi:MAG: TMEM164-related integral membrane acyltransferase [Planctomycetota bacterium]|jgi:hypothetical integral membrane protein (TIGR02206 family)